MEIKTERMMKINVCYVVSIMSSVHTSPGKPTVIIFIQFTFLLLVLLAGPPLDARICKIRFFHYVESDNKRNGLGQSQTRKGNFTRNCGYRNGKLSLSTNSNFLYAQFS